MLYKGEYHTAFEKIETIFSSEEMSEEAKLAYLSCKGKLQTKMSRYSDALKTIEEVLSSIISFTIQKNL